VLRLLATGLSNGELAEGLLLSPTTVKNPVGRILSKLDLCDRVKVVVLACLRDGTLLPGTRGTWLVSWGKETLRVTGVGHS
jgi:hypothetical protein